MREKAIVQASPVRAPDRNLDPRDASRQANGFVGLQQMMGNQAMLHLLASGTIQAKLRVSQPGDADELEADRIADSVVSTTEQSAILRKCNCEGGGSSCPACEEEEVEQAKGIHRKASASSCGDSVPSGFVKSIGPGQPLDSSTRGLMESRLGHDFGDVRIHTGDQAAQSARSIQARAYTFQRDVVFDSGAYAPQSAEGKKLLAHELTHALQQENGGLALHRQPLGHARETQDEKAARSRGRMMAEKIQKLRKLSPDNRERINSDLARFEGAAKEAYIKEIKPALLAVSKVSSSVEQATPNSSQDRAAAVAEAEAVVAKIDQENAAEDEAEDKALVESAPGKRNPRLPKTLSLLPEKITPVSVSDKWINLGQAPHRDLPQKPEEPDYWARFDDWGAHKVEIGSEVRFSRDLKWESTESVGDVAGHPYIADRSEWTMTRPALRAYLVHLFGSLTDFELKQIDDKYLISITPIGDGKEFVGYEIESHFVIEPGIVIHATYDRNGRLLNRRTTGGGVESEGIGPLVCLLPGGCVKPLTGLAKAGARYGTRLLQGAVGLGKAALKSGPARNLALSIGLAGKGAALAEPALAGTGAAPMLVEAGENSVFAGGASPEAAAQAATADTAIQSEAVTADLEARAAATAEPMLPAETAASTPSPTTATSTAKAVANTTAGVTSAHESHQHSHAGIVAQEREPVQARKVRADSIFQEAATAILNQRNKPVTEEVLNNMKRQATIAVLQGTKDGKLVTLVTVQNPKWAEFVKALLRPGEEFVEGVRVHLVGVRTGEAIKSGVDVHSEQVVMAEARDRGIRDWRVATSNDACPVCMEAHDEHYSEGFHDNPNRRYRGSNPPKLPPSGYR